LLVGKLVLYAALFGAIGVDFEQVANGVLWFRIDVEEITDDILAKAAALDEDPVAGLAATEYNGPASPGTPVGIAHRKPS
jgi:hypothetical protein